MNERVAATPEKAATPARPAPSTRRTGPDAVPPIVHDALRSPGQPLDPAARAFMEPRLGHDFGRVRIHADTRAAEAARELVSVAFTSGQHVFFGAGDFIGKGEVRYKGRRIKDFDAGFEITTDVPSTLKKHEAKEWFDKNRDRIIRYRRLRG